MPSPDPIIESLLVKVGFSNVEQLGHIKTDDAVVTALVERWRPEPHTFHLPVGECTITLEDVARQLGLHVDGKPITREPTTQQFAAHCRAYILGLIGEVLVPNKPGNRVHLMYPPLLADLDQVGQYEVRHINVKSNLSHIQKMEGCIALQSWAWYHMPFVQPRIEQQSSYLLATRIPRGDVIGYKLRFDNLHNEEFHWMTYKGFKSFIVMLQLGLCPDIPNPPHNLDKIHHTYMRGHNDINWAEKYQQWIIIWNERRKYFEKKSVVIKRLVVSWIVRIIIKRRVVSWRILNTRVRDPKHSPSVITNMHDERLQPHPQSYEFTPQPYQHQEDYGYNFQFLSASGEDFMSNLIASSPSFLSKAHLGGEAPSSLAYSLVDGASPLLFSFAFRCISMVSFTNDFVQEEKLDVPDEQLQPQEMDEYVDNRQETSNLLDVELVDTNNINCPYGDMIPSYEVIMFEYPSDPKVITISEDMLFAALRKTIFDVDEVCRILIIFLPSINLHK
ncbi:Protein MAIN-LIKE 1 [Glycine soja]